MSIDHKVGEREPPPAYDYSKLESWAAFPDAGMVEPDAGTGYRWEVAPAELVPDGETELPNAGRPADCFFIHPTGYFGVENWNQPAGDAQANERTGLMMGGQASAFSSACRIYAPKYRQSTIHAYGLPADDAEKVFGIAYDDCAAAFRHFIAEYNQGRPFVLASHSQGGHHMQRLLEEELEANWGTLGSRFVACYVVGSRIPEERITKTYKHLKLCQGPTESGVVIGWDTMSNVVDASNPKAVPSANNNVWAPGRNRHKGLSGKILGTNPYTWKTGGDAEPVSGEANLGLLHIKVGYPNGRNPDENGVDIPSGIVVTGLRAPLSPDDVFSTPPGWFTTQVDATTGNLLIPDPPESAPAAMRNPGQPTGGGYHVLDYTFFWANVRANVKERVDAFLLAKPKL